MAIDNFTLNLDQAMTGMSTPMKSLLPCLLLLPFLSGSSLKKRGRDDVSSPNFSEDEQPQKIQKKGNGLITPYGVSKNTDFDFIIPQVITYYPDFQGHLSKANHKGREEMRNERSYQELLASKLKIEGFKKLPFDSDLKVFDFFDFPDTDEGRVAAFSLAANVSRSALRFTAVRDRIFEVLFEEVVILLKSDHKELFEKVFAATRTWFSVFSSEMAAYFLENNLFDEILLLSKHDTRILQEVKHLLQHPHAYLGRRTEPFERNVLNFANYFNRNLEESKYYFPLELVYYDRMEPYHIPSGTILALLCSELPMEKIYSFLRPDIARIAANKFLNERVSKILNCAYSEIIPNQEFLGVRLVQLLEFAKQIHLNQNDEKFEHFKFLTKCRFEKYHLTEAGLYELKAPGNEVLEVLLAEMLISSKFLEEVVDFLPNEPSAVMLKRISENHAFCSVLAARKPDWIKVHFLNGKELIFNDSSLIRAYFGITELSTLFSSAPQNDLVLLAPIFFASGSYEEIKALLGFADDESLSKQYKLFSENHYLDSTRFAKILSIFIALKEESGRMFDLFIPDFQYNPSLFLAVLEEGGVEMVQKIDQEYFQYFELGRCQYFEDILETPEERFKLMSFRDALLDTQSSECSVTDSVFAPNELYYAQKFFDTDRVEHLRLVLKRARRYLVQGNFDFDEYFCRVVSISRSWYSAEPEIAIYSGPDFTKEFFAEKAPDSLKALCQSYLTGLTSTGRAVLLRVFAEIADIKEETDDESIYDD